MTSVERKKPVSKLQEIQFAWRFFQSCIYKWEIKKQAQPVQGICINLSYNSKGTAFLHQGVFRILVRYKHLQAGVTGIYKRNLAARGISCLFM